MAAHKAGPPSRPSSTSNTVVRVVVVALLLDLLAFTLPLPLFPRIIQGYADVAFQENPNAASRTLLARILSHLDAFRSSLSSSANLRSTASSPKTNTVLLGGFLGSLFSLCQFLVSPFIGSLSDAHGRRPILLLSMAGNILSALLWLFAGSFEGYLASRLVGGLSEGNVQLSIACISDVTPPEKRAKALALVGVCFAVAFTFGPLIGAILTTRVPAWTRTNLGSVQLPLVGRIATSEFAIPALATLILLLFETAYLYARLPETKDWRKVSAQSINCEAKSSAQMAAVSRPLGERKTRVKQLSRLLLFFSFIFSGTEFTLTFLTYDLFSYSNSQNGKLLGSIGLLSSLIQGGIVRRYGRQIGTGRLAVTGLHSCALALFFLARLPATKSSMTKDAFKSGVTGLALLFLSLASFGIAWTSGTVVNSLNTLASLECDTDEQVNAQAQSSATTVTASGANEGLTKGRALGKFRSGGQLGRALGPLSITAAYWLYGPTKTYVALAAGMLVLARIYRPLLLDGSARKKAE